MNAVTASSPMATNIVKFLPIVVNEQNVTFDLALSARDSLDCQLVQRICNVPPTTGPRGNAPFCPPSCYPRSRRQIRLSTTKSTPGRITTTLAFLSMRRTRYHLGGHGRRDQQVGRRGSQLEQIHARLPARTHPERLGDQHRRATQRDAVRIWTTNWPAEGADQQYGVSASDDGGRTWKNFLHGIKAYDFAFRDSITYVATEEGIFRTSDGGTSWAALGEHRRPEYR